MNLAYSPKTVLKDSRNRVLQLEIGKSIWAVIWASYLPSFLNVWPWFTIKCSRWNSFWTSNAAIGHFRCFRYLYYCSLLGDCRYCSNRDIGLRQHWSNFRTTSGISKKVVHFPVSFAVLGHVVSWKRAGIQRRSVAYNSSLPDDPWITSSKTTPFTMTATLSGYLPTHDRDKMKPHDYMKYWRSAGMK